MPIELNANVFDVISWELKTKQNQHLRSTLSASGSRNIFFPVGMKNKASTVHWNIDGQPLKATFLDDTLKIVSLTDTFNRYSSPNVIFTPIRTGVPVSDNGFQSRHLASNVCLSWCVQASEPFFCAKRTPFHSHHQLACLCKWTDRTEVFEWVMDTNQQHSTTEHNYIVTLVTSYRASHRHTGTIYTVHDQ